jgi:hypothetical protein
MFTHSKHFAEFVFILIIGISEGEHLLAKSADNMLYA